jgi:hypothetical protein
MSNRCVSVCKMLCLLFEEYRTLRENLSLNVTVTYVVLCCE